MNRCKKQISILLSVLMILSAFSALAVTYAAAPCDHVDADKNNFCDKCRMELFVERSWDDTEKKVVDKQKEIPLGSTEYTSAILTLEAGKWYIVCGDIEVTERIVVNGTPEDPSHLVICDGCTLKAKAGIDVARFHALCIYGQVNDSGAIEAEGCDQCAGIGGNSYTLGGTIIMHGCNITAAGGDRAAGVGGGSEWMCRTDGAEDAVYFTMFGGTLKATGTSRSAGIGGGYNGHGGAVTIYNGTVIAQGGDRGEGIGGYRSENASRGNFTLYGGNITASGGAYGAGIGHNVTVFNGEINAYGGSSAAGINKNFTMFNGTVKAYGSDNAAGIGGNDGYSNGRVEINGGTVVAGGGSYGAGIGGGKGAGANDVIIRGGTVTATGGYCAAGVGGGENGAGGNVTVYNGTLIARADYGSAGIGGGKCSAGGCFTIYYGTVTAYGGNLSAGIGGGMMADAGTFRMIGGTVTAYGSGAAGIGGGIQKLNSGEMTVTATAEIKAGADAPGTVTTVEEYIASRERFVTISGYCGHADANGDGICDYCDKAIYIDRTWSADKKAVADTLTVIPDSAKEINDSTRSLESGEIYVVNGRVNIGSSLTVNGDAGIILKNNSLLTAANGIKVPGGSSLVIYAQTDGADAGRLTAGGSLSASGIGGDGSGKAGSITVCGGNITASGGEYGAGIGGSAVSIFGGDVTAYGGENGAGIGSGAIGESGKVNLYGGKVNAVGGAHGAGIGGGYGADGLDVMINGGNVTASGGSGCDAIGSGAVDIVPERGSVEAGSGTVIYNGTDGTVITPGSDAYCTAINDSKTVDEDGRGTVHFFADTEGTAKKRISYLELNSENGFTESKSVSENTAFPIGSLDDWSVQWIEADGDITLNGSVTVNGNVNLILKDNCTLTVRGRIYVEGDNSLTVYAQSTGSEKGRLIAENGIGGGSKTACGAITIYGGTVEAAGAANEAGIGGGLRADAGKITIYDGTVTAVGGDNAAGIGRGYLGTGGEVIIYGGTVTANSGRNGEKGIDADSITIYDAQVYSNGELLDPSHLHRLTKTEAKGATCTEAGISTAYYVCTGDHACGRAFADADASRELADWQIERYVIKPLGHSFTSGSFKDNLNGTHSEKCIRCSEYGRGEGHELVNGKCTECGHCEHLCGTVYYFWSGPDLCEATKKCDGCGAVMLVETSTETKLVEDEAGKDCKTPGKGHYEAEFETLGTAKTESVFDTETGDHNYIDFVCEYCGAELLDEAKADANAAIDSAAGAKQNNAVKQLIAEAKELIDKAETVEEVLRIQNDYCAQIGKEAAPHIISAAVDKETVIRGENAVWTVVTAPFADYIRFVSNGEALNFAKGMANVEAAENEDGNTVWTITTRMTYTDAAKLEEEQTFTLACRSSEQSTWNEFDPEITVKVIKYDDSNAVKSEDYAPYSIVSASAIGGKKLGFTPITVVTTKDVTKLRFTVGSKTVTYTETSANTTVTADPEDENLIIWTIGYRFTAAGDYTVKIESRGTTWNTETVDAAVKIFATQAEADEYNKK